MEYRNAKWNAAGGIDCEINHPDYGWIPFTASADDVEAHGRELFDEITAGAGEIAAYVPPDLGDVLAAWRARATLTPTEFLIAAKRMGIITPQEALDAAKGTAPQAFVDLISANPDTDEIEAQILFARMTVVEYKHPLISAIIASGAVTADQMDAAFGWTGA